MIMKTPSFNANSENVTSGAIFNRIKLLEDSIHALVEKHNEQSKAESSDNTENKKLEEIFTRLRIVEKYKDEYGEAAAKDPMPNTYSPSYAYVVSNDVLNNRNAGSIQTKVLINEEESSQKTVLDKFNTDSGKTNNKAPWSTVLRKGKNSQITKGNSMNRKSWKEDLNLLHGIAINDAQSTALSANVDLVAYNVAKHVTSVMLSKFLAEEG